MRTELNKNQIDIIMQGVEEELKTGFCIHEGIKNETIDAVFDYLAQRVKDKDVEEVPQYEKEIMYNRMNELFSFWVDYFSFGADAALKKLKFKEDAIRNSRLNQIKAERGQN